MPEITSEEKTKLFEKLPKELRDFMESENTGAFLLYLGGKYKLSDDKVSLLSKLVGDVVLGITPVTSLAQEISLKITTDSQIAMNLSQELYADLLTPVLSKTPTSPQASVGAPAPQMPSAPPLDRYREPANGAPGIVDLRKAPPVVSRVEPLSPPPAVSPSISLGASKVEPPPIVKVEPLPPPTSPRSLTFTRPVEPIKPKPITPLIEAEPHLPAKIPSGISAGELAKILPEAPAIKISPPQPVTQNGPQYIIRPPGLAPTDLPRNILNLKKDKGEF